MKKLIITSVFLVLAFPLAAQKAKTKPSSNTSEIKVKMAPASWDFAAGHVEFLSHKNMPSMKIVGSNDMATLKNITFSNGTIEFDIDPQDPRFTGMYFRREDSNETEYFYLRTSRAGNPTAMDAAQYAPYNKGVNLWDLYDYYQGPANFKKDEWNHVKMVISGRQMIVYINDNSPTLEIPRLEGNTQAGGLAFNGQCIIANLTIRPDKVEGLAMNEGFDPTHHDPRFIRSWQMSEPQPLPPGKEPFAGELPHANDMWQPIAAERRGMVNLTRVFGGNQTRRYVWLKVRLISSKEQKKKIDLGFSDEVWVFVNRQFVFADKNIYTSPIHKVPDGRISIENSHFIVPLRSGENEMLIAVANDFYGWGLIARLEDMDGVEVNAEPRPQFPKPDLNPYVGTYSSPDLPVKIMISAKGGMLIAQAGTQPEIELEYMAKDKFSFVQGGIVFEFYPAEKKMILKEGAGVTTLMLE